MSITLRAAPRATAAASGSQGGAARAPRPAVAPTAVPAAPIRAAGILRAPLRSTPRPLAAASREETAPAAPSLAEGEEWQTLGTRMLDANPLLRDILTGPMAMILSSYWLSQSMYVMAKLKVPDLLSKRAMSVREIADAIDADAPSLFRVMRALAGQGPLPGLFIEVYPPPKDFPIPLPFGFSRDPEQSNLDRKYALTPLGAMLRSDMDGGMYPWAMMSGEEMFGAWGVLLDGVKTGSVPFEVSSGKTLWDFYNAKPESGMTFDRAMTSFTEVNRSLGGVIGRFDFTYGGQVSTVCDVGGGQGLLLSSMLKRHESLDAILFDRPAVFETGKPAAYLAEEGLYTSGPASRVAFAEGDFFTPDSIPTGADAYLMKNIIHDWDDVDASTILRNIKGRMPAGGRILLLELVCSENNAYNPLDNADWTQWFDLNMLVAVGGRERTQREFRALFEDAGLQLRRVSRGRGIAGGLCVIEAVDPSRPPADDTERAIGGLAGGLARSAQDAARTASEQVRVAAEETREAAAGAADAVRDAVEADFDDVAAAAEEVGRRMEVAARETQEAVEEATELAAEVAAKTATDLSQATSVEDVAGVLEDAAGAAAEGVADVAAPAGRAADDVGGIAARTGEKVAESNSKASEEVARAGSRALSAAEDVAEVAAEEAAAGVNIVAEGLGAVTEAVAATADEVNGAVSEAREAVASDVAVAAERLSAAPVDLADRVAKRVQTQGLELKGEDEEVVEDVAVDRSAEIEAVEIEDGAPAPPVKNVDAGAGSMESDEEDEVVFSFRITGVVSEESLMKPGPLEVEVAARPGVEAQLNAMSKSRIKEILEVRVGKDYVKRQSRGRKAELVQSVMDTLNWI